MPDQSKKRPWLRILLPWIVAALLLAWVLHGVNYEALGKDFRNIGWGWVLLGAFSDILCYSSQGFRWSLLLRPFRRIGWLRTTQAIYGSILFNQILPFRIGELVRAYLVSRWTAARLSNVFATIIVERLMDGFWLAGAFFAVAFAVDLPGNLQSAGNVFGAFVLIGVGLLLLLVQLETALPGSEEGRLWRYLHTFRQAFRKIGNPILVFSSLAASAPMLVFKAAAFWFVMIGYGVSASFWVATAVVVIEHVGTVIPNAPSNIGAYQFFATLGLVLFGVDKTQAVGISMLAFLMFTLPFFVLGPVALARSGVSLSEIRTWVRTMYGKTKLLSLPKDG